MSGTFYRYCGDCGVRLGSADFVSGRAVRSGHEIRCVGCVKRGPASPPSRKDSGKRHNTTRRSLISS